MGPRFESVKAHHTVYHKAHRLWPVGQVVKTAASHAVNIGSNPVRVTISFSRSEKEMKKESLDKQEVRRYNFIVF